MKMKISHRFLSLFAAVLVAFSLISTVALAAEIQPRIASCPNNCGGSTHYDYGWETDPYMVVGCRKHTGTSFRAYHYRYLMCSNCGKVEKYQDGTGYYCAGMPGWHF